ncbi:Protein MLO [Hordeum vulgare]|uniref:Protein MLO n=4 Tax=Hordeum vulgare TaxID=4513 RepID=MLO_HORVU|nr:protein MLO [Hordeum vulgare subsp. vulgare]P93766.1 RecName: Full=Protein MLO [Hordeum vulgare]KAE8799714.1 Protein MLO [Hordeum vulgare]CAA74909.1 Mlo protein [Hordeum vulgare subsp. vulgare]CAB06083.1 Mlo [Hordeum vulgare subsp. vulgare]
MSDKKGVPARELPETPSWAVAVVFAAMVLVSVLMEHGLHKLGHWFQHRHKKALWEALEKMKAELMLVGFISLLLIVTQDPIIAKICISEDAADVMWPCKRGTEGRKPSKYVDYCPEGKVALMSTGSLHQLHVFIFVLAVFHVTYSVITIALSRLKMRTWKKWETETTSLEYQFANDPARFRFTHQTSFVKRHLGLSSTPGIRWVVAFFRQFFRSVTKVDYLTLRAGFINAHLSQNSKFDFHKYIKRSMEDDFKVVVGISLPLWGVAILTLFLDINGVGTLIWISFIPLVILLCVGTKLEMIIMEMALEIQDRASVIKGAPVVEPSNKFFWFHRPDWVLFFIHLTLFQNAFQMAHFVWTVATPGLKKCYHTQIGLSIMKVVVGLALQFLCSYMTFPLYALVTQMGSNMKRSIFDEQTSKALTNWRNTAKEKKKVRDTDMLMAQMIGDATPSRGSSPMPSRGSSPVHLLHKGMGRSDDPQSAPTSPRTQQEARDMYPVVVAHPVHRLNPNDRRRSASSSALEADIPSADFSFSQG